LFYLTINTGEISQPLKVCVWGGGLLWEVCEHGGVLGLRTQGNTE